MSRLRSMAAAAARYPKPSAPCSLASAPPPPSALRALKRKPPPHMLSRRYLSTVSSSSTPSTSSSGDTAWMPALSMQVAHHDIDADPFRLVSNDLSTMTRSIRDTISVLQHPALDQAASHLLSLHGKRIRPIIVLLMAHATASLSTSASTSASDFPAQLRLAEITELIHAASLLHDDVIDVADTRRGALSVNSLFGNQLAVLAGDFLLARASVALARLRHCDVVELLSTVIEHLVRGEVLQMRSSSQQRHETQQHNTDQRTGSMPSISSLLPFSNVTAAISNSFLSSLAPSSSSLSSAAACTTAPVPSPSLSNALNHNTSSSSSSSPSSTSNWSSTSKDQQSPSPSQTSNDTTPDGKTTPLHGGIGDTTSARDWYHKPGSAFDTYLSKTFFKTASLVANSCRAVAMLGHHPAHVSQAAFAFGEGVGMAFQLVDDVLDVTASASTIGKPVLHDLRHGIVTAPVLFALDRFPDDVQPMIDRGFQRSTDLEDILALIDAADGVQQTRLLARQYGRNAVTAIVDALPPSEHRSALINLADFVLTRKS